MVSPPGAEHFLLTCHGTLITIDPAGGRLRGGDFLTCDLYWRGLRVFLAPADNGVSAATLAPPAQALWDTNASRWIGSLTPEPGPDGAGIALRCAGCYLTAEVSGAVGPTAPHKLAWETFLPIAADDIVLLRHVMTRAWLLAPAVPGAEPIRVPPRRIGFSSNFLFHVGPIALDMRHALPASGFASPGLLRLYADPLDHFMSVGWQHGLLPRPA